MSNLKRKETPDVATAFVEAPVQYLADLSVKPSNFRYENIESCLIKVLKEFRLVQDHSRYTGITEILFNIDCELKKSGGGLLTNAKIGRRCRMDWKLYQAQ